MNEPATSTAPTITSETVFRRPMLVCEAVRRLRGLSQVQVAERLAVAQTRISHIENGQRVPSTLLQHYAEVVGWVGELDVLQLQWDGSDLSAYLEAPYHLD